MTHLFRACAFGCSVAGPGDDRPVSCENERLEDVAGRSLLGEWRTSQRVVVNERFRPKTCSSDPVALQLAGLASSRTLRPSGFHVGGRYRILVIIAEMRARVIDHARDLIIVEKSREGGHAGAPIGHHEQCV